ncbi:LruC domain-containing protein, partial [Pseudopedobacter sp.]|uniref:LruC domain-containing protein n=1 Tax=Pseudopedobacter sp. TaxID=1936787 RepID=UPI00333E9F92
MKIKYFSILAIAFFAACKKDDVPVSDTGKSLSEVNISAQFDWKTTREVNFSFGVSDSRFSNKKHVITVYNGDPNKGGQIILKGSATQIEPYNTKIALPITMTQVYVVKTAPDGSAVSGPVNITSASVSVAISENGVVGPVSGVKSVKSSAYGASLLSTPVAETSPAVPTGAIVVSTSYQNGYNFEANKTYVISGNNIEINNINEVRGAVYVTGTNVALRGAKLLAGSELYILNGASVNFQNFNYNGNGNAIFKIFGTVTGLDNLHVKGTFYNTRDLKINGVLYVSQGSTATNFGSVLEVTSNLDNAGTFNNHGVLTVRGNLNSNNNNPVFLNTGTVNLYNNSTYTGTFTNDNTFNVVSGEVNLNGPNMVNNGTLTALESKMNVSGTFSNNGSVTVKELNNTGSGKIINNCKWWVLTNFNNDNRFDNYSYLQVDNGSNLKGTFNLYNGAMLSTKYLWAADGIIEGFGNDTSLVKVITSSNEGVSANGGVKFKGKFQYCDPSRTINPSRFDGVAKQGCGVYIAKTSCNTVGNGTAPAPVKPDTDGDGIIDEEDDYPNDPEKA